MKKNTLVFKFLYLIIAICLVFSTAFVAIAAPLDNFCNLVVFVRFSDDTTDFFNQSNTWSRVNNIYNNSDISFKNYMLKISDEKLVVNNVFVQQSTDNSSVTVATLSKTKAEYTSDQAIVGEVIQMLNNGTISNNFSATKLDYIDAGLLDNLTIVVQGSPSGRGDAIYPHKAVYAGNETFSGVMVRNYNILNSDNFLDSIFSAQQGVVSHEFIHSLGILDLYRENIAGEPVGPWCIMASTSYYQSYPLAYIRNQLGWLDIPKIQTSGSYTLKRANSDSGTRAYQIYTPLSDNQFFVVEYRKKSPLTNIGEFDVKIPDSGLVIYRVDTTISEQSNKIGNNYIYVFRPNPTSIGGATEQSTSLSTVNGVFDSAINPSKGTTSYGSIDLAKPYTDSTIYYSDGANSGIQISNVSYSSDGESISFDIDFADYSVLSLWDKLGADKIASNGSLLSSCYDPTTDSVYATYCNTLDGKTYITRFKNGTWVQVGDAINGISNPCLAVSSGNLYLAASKNSAYKPIYYTLTNNTWTTIYSSNQSMSLGLSFFEDEGNLYSSFVASNNKNLVVLNPLTGEILPTDLKATNYLSNPSVSVFGGKIYMLYSDFGVADTSTVLMQYDIATKTTSLVKKFTYTNSNQHYISVTPSQIAVYASANNKEPLFAVFDGTTWTEGLPVELKNGISTKIITFQNAQYVFSFNASTGIGKCFTNATGVWQQYGPDIATSVTDLSCVLAGDKIAVVYADTIKNIYGKAKQLSIIDDYTIAVTPPTGYNGTVLNVDGVEYNATLLNGKLSLLLPDKNASVITMYNYNAANVPIGMYVWTADYSNGKYSITAIPNMQDLLSYHGFSIRITGISGIRFKTGISVTNRNQLTSGGINGYKLKEYGTLFMNSAYRSTIPFVKDGTKVGSGRAYWIDNGTVNDKIFETVSGRYRFASVLVDIPVANYKTDFSFRGYAILQKDGKDIIIYGPDVTRSIYYVAQQVLKSGEFANGSPADLFVKKLIEDADK